MALKGFSYFALSRQSASPRFDWYGAYLGSCVAGNPGLPKKDTGVRSMIRFGGNLTGFATINYFARNGDNLLIGRFWGAEQLGIYVRAYQLMMLPIDQINEPMTTVAVPSLSRLVDAPEEYRRAYLRMIEKIAFLTMPSVGLMIVTADWIVRIVLGPRWAEVATILQILGAAALVQPIANTTGWLFVTQGRTNEIFKMAMCGGPNDPFCRSLDCRGELLGWQCRTPLFTCWVHRSCIGTFAPWSSSNWRIFIVEPFHCSQPRFWEC